ncbi:hypothetical protein OsI_38197 [Oryza sativa Indica Group]|uniref:Uncharacterized protein n=1 Tax=Oryza sativa subsp. indica TaxID=39946 RepID=B8BPF6_ORYSI|nr:hypothetical protein OsI_38197 [Oryza sativa Indica Group]
MEMLEQLYIETDNSEMKGMDLTLCGHVVAQSLRADILVDEKKLASCIHAKGDDCTRNQTDVEDEKTWDDENGSQQNIDMDDARENTNGLNSDFDYFTLNNMHQPFTEEQDDGGHTSTHHVFTAEQPKVETSSILTAIMDQLMQLQQSLQHVDNKLSSKLISLETICLQNRLDIQDIKSKLCKPSTYTTVRKNAIQGINQLRSSTCHQTASTIGARLRRPEGRVIKPTFQSQTDFVYYKNSFAMAQTTSKEPKDLTLLDEITISFISKSKKRKLSTIANIDIFSETLMPLVRPIDAPSKSKWLGGSIFLPLNRDKSHCWSCGLFALKCMEHWNGKDLSPEFHEMDTTTTFRAKVASTLINSTMNEVIQVQEELKQLCIETTKQGNPKADEN